MKAVIAESERVLADPRGIQALLDLLCLGQTTVTDATRFGDFGEEDILVNLGGVKVLLLRHLTLWEAVATIRNYAPNWPKKG